MRSTKSLCPECLNVIDASIFEQDGKMMIEKNCKEHGYFKDIYWSNAYQFRRFGRYWHDGSGVDNPNTKTDSSANNSCPHSCGICSSHKTSTIMANIDVTNRCNQKCPVCFANASASGYLYEPSIEQLREMMQMLKDEKPISCPAVQFSGGEPTMRDDIVDIVKMAQKFDFAQIQMATNGIKLAKDQKLCKDLNDAGLNTVYLQFDGVTEKPYQINRGYNALPIKLKAIENCRKEGFTSITLVPTLAKGVNDDQVGDILRFAANNVDVVRSVNFQPISFTGRINKEERMEKRVTIPYLLDLIKEQTNGEITAEDFYPIPFVVPFSHFDAAQKNKPCIEFSVHPHCGAGTYIYIENGKMIPITRFVDVEGLLECIDKLASYDNKWIGGRLVKAKRMSDLILSLSKYIDTEKSPKSINIKELFIEVLKYGTKEPLRKFHRNTLFVGAMHFMDLYNMDLERIQRCGIHYATPDGRIIPFCTYNTIHRAEVEKKFSTPLIR